jgi:hypothetical protein
MKTSIFNHALVAHRKILFWKERTATNVDRLSSCCDCYSNPSVAPRGWGRLRQDLVRNSVAIPPGLKTAGPRPQRIGPRRKTPSSPGGLASPRVSTLEKTPCPKPSSPHSSPRWRPIPHSSSRWMPPPTPAPWWPLPKPKGSPSHRPRWLAT